MDFIILVNLVFALNASCSLFAWTKQNFKASYLHYLLFYLSLNTLLGIVLTFVLSNENKSNLKRTLAQIFCNLCSSVPIYFVLILLVGVHLPDLKSTLHLAILLSLLTVYPNPNGVYQKGIFLAIRNKSTTPTSLDKFVLINYAIVVFCAWFASFMYGLDSKTDFVKFPVASCLGSIVGSILTNSGSIICYLFQNYNTLGVY